jgi:peptidoglycan lytic transglycosylase
MLALGCLSASADEGSTGMASFYSAAPESSYHLTAAHRHLPLGTRVRVTRIDTGRHVIVRINDRGPFVKGRIIDVSRQAAELLGMIDAGVTRVKLEVVEDAVVKETAIAPTNCEACALVGVETLD